ncbi:subtilisin-like protease [Tanacetum coccineum]
MENMRCNLVPSMTIITLLLTFTIHLNLSSVVATETETYIVQLSSPRDHKFAQNEDLESWYSTFLPTISLDSERKPQMVYAYRNVLQGFAARLTVEQVKQMREKDGVISVWPQRVLSLHTTHTPNFLGLQLDLGVWRVESLHLMHKTILSILVLAAGITLLQASLASLLRNNYDTNWSSALGNDNGTAAGMAPFAHLAMYKVCDENGCSESDIVAGMDAAVDDGVDVLSLSLGGGSIPFYNDGIAIGAFAATQKGIFVSCSAGNEGPFNASLSNEAPWILTVGASTVDRKVKATVKLGNGTFLDGESLFQPKDFSPTLLPLVYPGMNGDLRTTYCAPGTLNNTDVKGKVVICLRGGEVGRVAKGQIVKDAGGSAMILTNEKVDGFSTIADAHVLPVSYVGYKDGLLILEYLNSTPSPVATIIFHGTVIGDKSAPQVTSFSSRGPSVASPGILKPDIIGPGVSILAAWPVSVDNKTTTAATFNVVSGTSMSCPHLSGIATLLKSAHPAWSPAAIKSAIMTTADLVNLNNQPIEDEQELPASLFAIGAGHVNPSKASDPGLIYDLQPDDYIPYLCGLGYSSEQVIAIVQKQVSCVNSASIPSPQLNYPSFSIKLSTNVSKSYTRTVTNVGDANSSYTLKIYTPPNIAISVSPSTLTFSAVNQMLSYEVTFTPIGSGPVTQFSEGALLWNSAKHSVRSPISIRYT